MYKVILCISLKYENHAQTLCLKSEFTKKNYRFIVFEVEFIILRNNYMRFVYLQLVQIYILMDMNPQRTSPC